MDEAQAEPREARGGDGMPGIASDSWSRKRFMAMVGGTGAAGAFSTLVAACGGGGEGTTPADDTPASGEVSAAGDLEIVQYALTLEFLEADFYDQVIKSGEVKDSDASKLIREVYGNEKEHVDALKRTVEQLGAVPNKPPKTDFESVLNGGEEKIIETSAVVENLGASAYLGQADKIFSPQILAAALSIHTVEARHAARFNELAGNGFTTTGELRGSVPDGAFAKPMDMDSVLKKVQPFLAS